MKITASNFTRITLSILIAGSIAACSKTKTDSATATKPAIADKSEIVFINQDSLTAKYNYVKDMAKRLEDKGKAAQSDAGGREQAFQREVAEYQKNMNTITADQRATTEQRLGREKQELQTYEQNTSAQLQNDRATETQKLYEKVYEFTKQYAKEKGYKMVLTFQNGNPGLLYADPTRDITADVIKRLNDAYAKEKK